MKKGLILFFLVAYLDVPSKEEWPPRAVQRLAAGVDHYRMAAAMAQRCVHFPAEESVSEEFVDGAYNVFWRRAQGRPFPYPTDPVLGQRP